MQSPTLKTPEREAMPMLEALESLDDCRMRPWIWNIVCNVLLFQSISFDLSIQIRESNGVYGHFAHDVPCRRLIETRNKTLCRSCQPQSSMTWHDMFVVK